MQNDAELRRFRDIHSKLFSPSTLWISALAYPKHLDKFALLARMCTLTNHANTALRKCSYCQRDTADLIEHLFCFCDSTDTQRERFWQNIETYFSVEFEVLLVNLSDYDFVNIVLGASLSEFNILSKEEVKIFRYICAISYQISLDNFN